ncbi:MAG: Hsp20/alpha crystallin family protein [Armatimonadetes bacterium]|nr:Hsp20/alpha crystallin family protein [Armatimonadota bacterium]
MAMLTRYNPRSWLLEEPERTGPLQLRHELDRMFRDFFREPWPTETFGGTTLSPRLNVAETDREYTIELELPGIRKEDVDISLQEGMLVIRGECKQEKEEEGRRFHRVERCYGSFSRSLSLPTDADPEKIQARMDNGILYVTLAKSKEAERKTRKINVK